MREAGTNSSDTVQDTDIADGYDSDHFSEVDAYEHAANIDTIIDDTSIETHSNNILTFAPGEVQHPLSLYQDTDAEYLCFSTIFCGKRRPENKERLTPVNPVKNSSFYSDIAKWELRSVDRGAAQSVPNIFLSTRNYK